MSKDLNGLITWLRDWFDDIYLTEHQDISGKADVNDLGNTAFSNSYNDLDNLPTIPTVPTNVGAFTNDSGYLTSQDISQNVFYGTCSTTSSTQTKAVTCPDWSFTTGNIIFVQFTFANTYEDGHTKIQIGDTSKNVKISSSSTLTAGYHWKSGEIVAFVYDGTDMVMVNEAYASTTYYGVTKLSDSTSSTSTSLSATANAVKKAYDLANGKANAVHTHTVSDVTDFPSIPSNTSDLTNDGSDGTDTYVETEDLLDLVYPIGSIYMSVSNVSPSTLFGGTWEAIEDKFLLSSGTTYTPTYDNDGFANKTGGEASHSLTKSEMPRHTHIQNAHHHTFNRYQNNGSTTNYSTGWTNQKLTSQNTSDTTATNQYTGGTGSAQSESDGVAHNNMPPYLVVNVWKRTA